MYHQFKQNTSQDEILNNKLLQLISFYQYQHQSLNRQQQGRCLQGQIQSERESIRIEMSVYNEKYGGKLFVLSNRKVLRYDVRQSQLCEVVGLEIGGIVDVKVLQIGDQERYLVLKGEEVFVCEMLSREEQLFKEELEQFDQCQQQMVQQRQQKQMKEQRQEQQLIMEEQQSSSQCRKDNNKINKQVKKSKIKSQLLTFQQFKQSKWSNRVKKMFVVRGNDKTDVIKHKDQYQIKGVNKLKYSQQYQQQEVFVVVVAQPDQQNSYYEIKVSRVGVVKQGSCCRQNQKGNINQKEQFFQNNQKGQSSESNLHKQSKLKPCTIQPLRLPNNCYSMQLLITDIDLNKQHQNTSIEYIKINNQKYTKSNMTVKIDEQVVTLKAISAIQDPKYYQQVIFSIYFGSQQAMTEWMNVQQQANCRHRIFQYVFMLSTLPIHCSYVSNETTITLSCPSSSWLLNLNQHHPAVLSPHRMYFLPNVQRRSILRYFSVNKTYMIKDSIQETCQQCKQRLSRLINQKTNYLSYLVFDVDGIDDDKQQAEQYYYESVKISVVSWSNKQNKLTFIECQIPIIYSVQDKSISNKYAFYVNRENASLFNVVNSVGVVRNVLMWDCVNKYAVVLVNKDKVNKMSSVVNQQLFEDKEQQQEKGEEKGQSLKLVLLNLSSQVQLNQSRQLSSYYINKGFNDNINQLSLHFYLSNNTIIYNSNIYNNNNKNSSNNNNSTNNNTNRIQLTSLYGELSTKPNIANLYKQIHITNTHQLTQTIQLIPKVKIYQSLLSHVLTNKLLYQQTKSQQLLTPLQSTLNIQSFINNVIKLLTN